MKRGEEQVLREEMFAGTLLRAGGSGNGNGKKKGVEKRMK